MKLSEQERYNIAGLGWPPLPEPRPGQSHSGACLEWLRECEARETARKRGWWERMLWRFGFGGRPVLERLRQSIVQNRIDDLRAQADQHLADARRHLADARRSLR